MYHLWYLYMIIGVYLLIPILIRFKNSITSKAFNVVSWTFLILSMVSALTSTNILNWDIGFSFEALGFFMIGYELKNKFEIEKNNLKGCIYIVIGLLIELLIVFIQYKLYLAFSDIENTVLISIYNPLMVISSILIFIGFSNIEIKRDFSKISNLTLYIYIFHAMILSIVFNILKVTHIVTEKNSDCRIVIPVLTVIIFILSYILSKVWIKIWSWINKNNRIYNKVDRLFDKLSQKLNN